MDIENLKEKLEGNIPITKKDLIDLINSWKKYKYDLSRLDTSKITDMKNLFSSSDFEGDISRWDVSNVTNMERMFVFTTNFNCNISSWDTSNVINMRSMFLYASKFNQDISSWNISKVNDMSFMFCEAKKFNQDISKWDLSNKILVSMFLDAKEFENKYNNGKTLPKETNEINKWFNDNIKSIFIKNKNLKIEKNKEVFNYMIEEFNIDLDSSIGKDLIKMYNKTQDQLKEDLNKHQKKAEKDKIIEFTEIDRN